MTMNPVDPYIKQYDTLISQALNIANTIRINRTNDVRRLLHVFATRQISLLKSIQKLANAQLYYEGCILLTTFIENYILQKWLIVNNKILDYLEFAATESLPRLAIHPEETREVLQFIKEHNVQRFLKKGRKPTEQILLDSKNYCAPWQNLTKITDDLTRGVERSEVKDLKKAYNLLCGYKHSSAYSVLARMGYPVVPQDAFLLYSQALYAFICNLVLIDQCCNINGLKDKLRDIYLKSHQLSTHNPIIDNELEIK